MNIRQRRLMSDYEKIREEFARHRSIRVQAMGNPPYERYNITYFVKSLYWDVRQDCPCERSQHEVEIYLGLDYPREKPQCQIKTPVFHPNFGAQTICIGDHWAASSSLLDTIVKIGEMLQFRDYNPKSPLNSSAARWVIENKKYLPIGKIDLYSPEPEIAIGEKSNASTSDEDDLDICLGPAPQKKTVAKDEDLALDIVFK